MSFLARPNILTQFTFHPALDGITLPDMTENAARMIYPDNPVDAYVFAETNRAIRSEATHGAASRAVRLHNEAKTVLGTSANPHHTVESLFQYLDDDGMIDRSVDLREDRDLLKAAHLAQTIIEYRIPEEGRETPSSVSKSMACKHPGDDRPFGDFWYKIHLTGRTLRLIAAHPSFLDLHDDNDVGLLAVHLSAFLYLSDSFEDPEIFGDGLYLIDAGGRAVRMFHPETQDFHEAFGLLHGNFPDPKDIRVTSRPPDPTAAVSFHNQPYLDMRFSSNWLGREELHVDLQVNSTPQNKKLILRNALQAIVELLLESSQRASLRIV